MFGVRISRPAQRPSSSCQLRQASEGEGVQHKARLPGAGTGAGACTLRAVGIARAGFEEFPQQRGRLVFVIEARPHQDGVGGFQLGSKARGGRTHDSSRCRLRQSQNARFRQSHGELYRHGLRHSQGEPAGAGAEGSDAGQQRCSGSLPGAADHQHRAAVVLSGTAAREGPTPAAGSG